MDHIKTPQISCQQIVVKHSLRPGVGKIEAHAP